MPDSTPNAATPDLKPLHADATRVAGGGDCVSPAGLEPDMTGTYDALVDATSQLIEVVITAAKSY